MSWEDRREWVLWATAAAAVSPVLVDLMTSLSEIDGSPSVLLPPCLFALYAWREGVSRARPRPIGSLLVAFGLGIQIVGVVAGIDSLARLGLPWVIVGVALLAGRPTFPIAALAFWMVPLPHAVLTQWSPVLESRLAAYAILPLQLLGSDVSAVGRLIRIGSERLEVTAFQGGLTLALLLAQLGWYAALRHHHSLPALVGHAALAAVLSPILQIVSIGLAVLVAMALGSKAGRLWLDYVFPLGLTIAFLAWVELRPPLRSRFDGTPRCDRP
jgi:hypothetical protein